MDDEETASLYTGFPFRVGAFAAVLVVEALVAILLPHYRFGVPHFIRGAPIVFGICLLLFGGKQLAESRIEEFPIRYRFVVPNIVFFILFLFAGFKLAAWAPDYGPQQVATWHFRAVAALWIALLALLILALIAVALPLREVARLSRRLGIAWLYAAICAVLSVEIRSLASTGWDFRSMSFEQALESATFGGTRAVLRWLYPVVVSVPSGRILGTPHFIVWIRGICSGMEGMALIGTVTVAWLVFARRELRMGRAMLLIPLALFVMWSMNVLRLVVLIVIGTAGHPKIALDGFHSVAGWIAFNLVSAGFLLVAHRVQWFREPELEAAFAGYMPGSGTYQWRNVPAIYLAPFLAIVASSMISQAATGGFEWLYPLRFVVAVAVMWWFRGEYRSMDWSFGWLGPVAGLVIAALWLAVRLRPGAAAAGPDVTADGLARLPGAAQMAWIAVRVLAAVTTVPIAEELAFRGFAARAVTNRDVERVPYTRLSWAGILLSSVLFGVMHREMWIMGIVSGVVFALVAKFRGRLGEALAAHVTANLAIAIAGLALRNYSLW